MNQMSNLTKTTSSPAFSYDEPVRRDIIVDLKTSQDLERMNKEMVIKKIFKLRAQSFRLIFKKNSKQSALQHLKNI